MNLKFYKIYKANKKIYFFFLVTFIFSSLMMQSQGNKKLLKYNYFYKINFRNFLLNNLFFQQESLM